MRAAARSLTFAFTLGLGVVAASGTVAVAQVRSAVTDPAAAATRAAKVVTGFNPYLRNCTVYKGAERAYCEARNKAADGCAEYLRNPPQMLMCLQVSAPPPLERSCDAVNPAGRESCMALQAQNAKCAGREGIDRWNCRLANAKPLERTERGETPVAPLPPTPARPQDPPVIARDPQPLSERLDAGPPPGWSPDETRSPEPKP